MKIYEPTPFVIAKSIEVRPKKGNSLTSGVSSLAKKTFEKIDSTWTYAGKGVTITKRALQAGSKVTTKAASKVGKAVKGLKFFKAVEIPLNLYDAGKEVFKIPSYLKIHDWEGASLSVTGLMLLLTDTVDAFSTLTDVILDLDAYPLLSALNQIMLPVAIGLVSVSSIVKGYKAIVSVIQLRDLNQHLKDGTDLKKYVKELIGVTTGEKDKIREKLAKRNLNPDKFHAEFEKQVARLKKKKANRMQRRANGKVVKALTDIVNDPNKLNKPEELKEVLKQLKQAIKKNICVQTANILANLVILTGLILFFAPIPPVLPFIFLGLGTAMKLGILLYDDFL